MSVIILANSIFMGISMEQAELTAGWFVAESIFTFCFFMELSLSLIIKGPRTHLFENGSISNTLDATLVVLDVAQLIVGLTMQSTDKRGVKASLFRILRLARITRILRLLRMQKLKDLVYMILGMLSGVGALLWAILLYMIMIYVFALVFRELLRDCTVPSVRENFGGVIRSMFT